LAFADAYWVLESRILVFSSLSYAQHRQTGAADLAADAPFRPDWRRQSMICRLDMPIQRLW